MSRVAIVLSVERVMDEGGHGLDVKVDPGGGNNVIVPHFSDPGDDSVPLPGDSAALEESSGTGAEQCAGYADTKNAGKSVPGEKRIYGRDADGNVVSEVHLRRDGKAVIIADEVVIQANVRIEGSLAATGEVTAKADTLPVGLSTHLHPTAVGPTQKPTGGT